MRQAFYSTLESSLNSVRQMKSKFLRQNKRALCLNIATKYLCYKIYYC